MNREIKFRAWVHADKTLIGHREVIERAHLLFQDSLNASDAVMQYTGLKDKNGVEIYEGDWVRCCWRNRNGIQYKQGNILMDEFMWCINSGEDGIYSINRLHDFEVLSNIYENPELIQE